MAGTTYAFGELSVACSNVDRVMFPGDGITKGDMLAYYRDIADLMVPELRGRPLSVVRYTKGIDQRGFFQKHYQKHFPAWLGRVTAGAKTQVDYPIVDSPAGVVYMANQGAIEFHIWTSRTRAPGGAVERPVGTAPDDSSRGAVAPASGEPSALDRPDTLVFDLDPPDGRFDLVRRTALILRELLDQLGLPGFVKTTGSKGLHVIAPLDAAATFAEAGALSGRIGALLCRRYPELLTMEFYKQDRRGRLFMDTMRNAIGATLVAPYSLRGRNGAPVSAPIAWHEVEDPALGADRIGLRDLRARLDRLGDLWRDLRRAPGSVASATRALDQLGEPP